MNRTNLIPPRRRRAKARQARLCAWGVGIGTYAALLSAATLLLVSGVVGSGGMLRPTAAAAREKAAAQAAAQAQKELVLLRDSIARSQQSALSAEAVTDSPDWSRLLAVVAHSLGSDVVLDQCNCVAAASDPAARTTPPTAANAFANAASGPRQMVLRLSGLGRSQGAVADFVLRLEGLGLFQQVQLLQTSRMITTDGQVVSFKLDCPLRGVVEDPS